MGFDEQEYTRSFDIRSWKKLLPFLRPYRGLIAAVIVLNVFCAVIDIALPLFQRYAIDAFIETGDLSGLPGFAVFYGLVIAAQALAVILFTRRSMRIEMQVGRDMKRACFVHLQTLSLSYYNVTPVGYLLSRIMSDTNRIAGMIACVTTGGTGWLPRRRHRCISSDSILNSVRSFSDMSLTMVLISSIFIMEALF